MEGPAFSTRAESELCRSRGVSVVGMTNLAEAKLAREAKMCYATLALVTGFDCRHKVEEAVAAQTALVTGPEQIPAKARERLDLIIGKHLQ